MRRLLTIVLFAALTTFPSHAHYEVGQEVMCNTIQSENAADYERVTVVNVHTPGVHYQVLNQYGMEVWCNAEFMRPATSADPYPAQEAPADNDWLNQRPTAAGVPDDGYYTCGKISGSRYMIVGNLTLQSGPYEGFGSNGDIALNADDTLSFMDGLRDFPDIVDVRFFIGTAGERVLRIAYTSPSGWAEELDCSMD